MAKKKKKLGKKTKSKKKAKTYMTRKKPVKRKIVKKKVHKKILKKTVKKPKIVKKLEIVRMDEEKAFDMVKRYRIQLPVYSFCKNEKNLKEALKKVKYPCVMKVSSRYLLHRTEVNGIRRGIENEADAEKAFKELMRIKGAEKVLIQEELSGVEVIVGAKRDPSFGYVVVVGLGGTYVELFKDVRFRVTPITRKDAEEMVKELRGYEVLNGLRGGKPIKFSILYETILKISNLAAAKKIKEMDINPLFCNEKGCWAADVRIIE